MYYNRGNKVLFLDYFNIPSLFQGCFGHRIWCIDCWSNSFIRTWLCKSKGVCCSNIPTARPCPRDWFVQYGRSKIGNFGVTICLVKQYFNFQSFFHRFLLTFTKYFVSPFNASKIGNILQVLQREMNKFWTQLVLNENIEL